MSPAELREIADKFNAEKQQRAIEAENVRKREQREKADKIIRELPSRMRNAAIQGCYNLDVAVIPYSDYNSGDYENPVSYADYVKMVYIHCLSSDLKPEIIRIYSDIQSENFIILRVNW